MPSALALGDLDGDGKLDIVVTGNYQPGSVAVLLGTGGGIFSTARTHTAGTDPSAILVGARDVLVLHNAGNATFDTTWSVPCGCGRLVVVDLNQDGKPDLVGVDVVQSGATWNSRSNLVSVVLHAP